MEEFRDVVVRLDLGGIGVESEAEGLDECAADRRPIGLRIRRQVRVVVADGTIHFAEERRVRHLIALPRQACDHVSEFLADSRRRGGLAVRPREHRLPHERPRQIDEITNERIHRRQEHVVASRLQHQRVGEVVDVFRRAREMHELSMGGEARNGLELGLDEILDRFDVVIGGRLDLTHGRGVRR